MNNAFTQLDQKQKLSNEVIKQLEDSIRNKVLILNQEIPAENELCNIFVLNRTIQIPSFIYEFRLRLSELRCNLLTQQNQLKKYSES